ncbi:MAG: tRNA preQ1(34) S-adenosylmethionine ribosyltransferase-isomerase QueA [Saezia sp.]
MITPTHPSSPRSLSDFDFQLPEELIAQHPAVERTASRLLDGTSSTPVNRIFKEIVLLLQPNDLLIFNDTKVIKARLFGEKPTGGKLELLVERVLPNQSEQKNRVVAHIKVSKKPLPDTVLQMQGGFTAKFIGRWPDKNGTLFELEFSDDPYALMQAHGHVPLPPYITHDDTAEDETRYQTVFAKVPGAVAAPTAALHFDDALLQELKAQGVQFASVTLHVGAGTFAPVKTENIAEHKMHFERYEVPPSTVQAIEACRLAGGRIMAVGTTSVRALETWAKTADLQGDTNIFITPGFQFKVVDLLLTNFHLPKSTLMMLVSAFAGYEHIKTLYAHAIAEKYHFFSYGDAMLLKRHHYAPTDITK